MTKKRHQHKKTFASTKDIYSKLNSEINIVEPIVTSPLKMTLYNDGVGIGPITFRLSNIPKNVSNAVTNFSALAISAATYFSWPQVFADGVQFLTATATNTLYVLQE